MFVRMEKYANLAFLRKSAFELKHVSGEMTMKF